LGILLGVAVGSAAAAKMPVAASIAPLGDFCRHLGGDLVEVQVLIPPGANLHAFEPAPSVIARASQARIFIYIGAGLEPWAARVLHVQEAKDRVVVAAAAGIPLLEAGDHGHGPEEAHEGKGPGPHEPEGEHHHKEDKHQHQSGNPHIWLDPVLAKDICRRVSAALIKADPAHAARYEANLRSYLAALDELDQEYRTQINTWRQKAFISFHPAFSYLARRYGLREVGVMEVTPGREPTPRHMQGIVAAVRHSGVKVMFTEAQFNPRVAQVIAQEAGVKVLVLDPMGGKPPYGSDYLQLMRHNLAVMAEAMK